MSSTRTAGRHDLERVPEPAAGYASDLPGSVHNGPGYLRPVAIPDLYDGRKRVRALARIDLLDRERSAGRIDEASYLAGRQVESVFEGMHATGRGQWLDSVGGSSSPDLRAIACLERAVLVNDFLGWLMRVLGELDTRLLWLVLGNGLGFEAASALYPNRRGKRGMLYTADRFRDALATLATAKAARGKNAEKTRQWRSPD